MNLKFQKLENLAQSNRLRQKAWSRELEQVALAGSSALAFGDERSASRAWR